MIACGSSSARSALTSTRTIRSQGLTEQLPLLHRLIQSKLADGRLPYNSIPRLWGGAGNGETCDACGETITKKQIVMEGVGVGKKAIQFHVCCFSMWDELRRPPGT